MRHDQPRQPITQADPLPTLFDHGLTPMIAPTHVAGSTIDDNFHAFHQANPWVYTALVRLARDMIRAGRRRIGIGMLYEVLRWQYTRATLDQASDFKLNNNYRSRYARLIMATETDLDGAFDTRQLSTP